MSDDSVSPVVVQAYAALERAAGLVRDAAADRRASRLEREQVARAARFTIARMQRYAERLQGEQRRELERFLRSEARHLAALDEALLANDVDGAFAALDSFLSAYGRALPWATKSEFDQAMERDDFVLDLTHRGSRSPRARRRLPAMATRALGERVPPPIQAEVAAQVDLLCSDPHELHERMGSGVQIAIDRRLEPLGRGTVYTHHGLHLGDGRVVHFWGEMKSPADAKKITLETLVEFAAPGEVAGIYEIRAETFDGRPVASLRGAVSAVRALSRIGKRGYRLLGNNCEHFAVWSRLGAHLSLQVAQVEASLKRAYDASTPTAEATAAVNEERQHAGRLTFSRRPLGPPEPGTARIFDLGRAYWAEDLSLPVIWLPLWEGGAAPPAGFDRPWTARDVSFDGGWSRACPSTDLRRDWHASLVYLESAGLYWALPDGQWLEAKGDVHRAINERLDASSQLLVQYLTQSYGVSKLLAALDATGVTEWLGDAYANRPVPRDAV